MNAGHYTINTAAAYDAMLSLGLEPYIFPDYLRPISNSYSCCCFAGPAFLCQGFFTQEREDPLIHAITLQSIVEQMPKKAVIILAMEPPMVAQSVLGDITAAIFARAGASGVILDGYTRDVSRISQMSFPLWSRGATVRDANGKWTIGQIGMSHLPKAGVSANDTILADRDGILVIPSEHQEAVFRAISSIGEHETRIRAAIRNGRKPDDIVQEFGIW